MTTKRKKIISLFFLIAGLGGIIFFLSPQTWYMIVLVIILSGFCGFFVASFFLKRTAACAVGSSIVLFLFIQAIGIGSLLNTALLLGLTVALVLFLSD